MGHFSTCGHKGASLFIVRPEGKGVAAGPCTCFGGSTKGAAQLEVRLTIEDLEDALARGRIEARYQPIVNMADRRPTGFEVLARLDHPVHGLVEADIFVPAMEAAGLGRRLSEAVVSRAVQDWQAFDLGALGMTIAVNLPLDVLMMPDTPDWLEAALHGSTLGARQLVIELTESQELGCMPSLASAVERYRALGYRLAIDDVGPEIRDHRPLLDLPFSMMKLDRGLVLGVGDAAAREEFLDFALTAAHEAGLLVVAEGIEDASSWGRMAAAGIDQAQGFHIGYPMRASEIADWHADWIARGR